MEIIGFGFNPSICLGAQCFIIIVSSWANITQSSIILIVTKYLIIPGDTLSRVYCPHFNRKMYKSTLVICFYTVVYFPILNYDPQDERVIQSLESGKKIIEICH